MEYSEKLGKCRKRYQQILLQRARVEETVRQQKEEAEKHLSTVESIVGVRDTTVAEKMGRELYEKMHEAFQSLEKNLDHLQSILGV